MTWAIAVLALGAMAAAGFEIWLATRQHPRRLVYAWLAWTPLAFLGVFAGSWDTASPAASAVLAALAAPFAYPVVRGLIWLRFESRFQQAEEDAADAERMKYRAMDFGGSAAPRAKMAEPVRAQAARPLVQSPIAAPTRSSRLDRATRERRPAWVGRAEILLIVGVCAVGVALYVGSMVSDLNSQAPSDEEMVAGTLELNGYGGPRVTPTGETCADGRSTAYRWSAVGSEGRACADAHEGQVSLWVERRWP
jgi:hypothetical protein